MAPFVLLLAILVSPLHQQVPQAHPNRLFTKVQVCSGGPGQCLPSMETQACIQGCNTQNDADIRDCRYMFSDPQRRVICYSAANSRYARCLADC